MAHRNASLSPLANLILARMRHSWVCRTDEELLHYITEDLAPLIDKLANQYPILKEELIEEYTNPTCSQAS
jgi:hypothetical protein